MPAQPNIILVLTDDQGYPALGSSGHPFIRTPHLDRFHGESVRFVDFHSGTTCAPTRAGLYTGHYCNSTGVWHTIGGRSLLRRDEWSIADALRGAGYRTALFGKWHLGDEYPYRPQDRGFDHVVCHGGGGVSQQPDWWGNDYFDDTYLVNGEPIAFKGYCTDVFFKEAMRFIDTCTSREAAPGAASPFFCVISTNAPHGPFNVDPRYRDFYAEHTESDSYARFLGMCTNIDDNFGRLRQHLAGLGVEDDTILMFMSDNGQTGVGDETADQYNSGMRGLKGSPYEGGHRIPFFMRWPAGDIGAPDAGTNAGRDITELAAYIDLMPTLLDLAGVEVASGRTFHGESLVPLVREAAHADARWDDRILVTDTQRVAHPLKWRLSCVMKGRWRLVNHDELYDLASDPGQATNLIDRHPELVAELRDAYEEWWRTCTVGVDREVPVPIGAPGRTEAILRSHDIRNDLDQGAAWHQGHVRTGAFCVGWWEIEAQADGEYEFELRRWPREAGHAIAAGIDGDDVEWNRGGVQPRSEYLYTGGRAMGYTQATLIVDDSVRSEADVEPGADAVVLRASLSKGPHHLRALFSNSAGDYSAAYYVHVRRG